MGKINAPKNGAIKDVEPTDVVTLIKTAWKIIQDLRKPSK